MCKGKVSRSMAWSLALGLAVLAGAPAAARAGEESEKEKKVEKRKVTVISSDGKPFVWEGDGLLVSRGYLGVGLTDLTPELRTHFGAPEDAGVMVAKVEPGSPAATAGIKVGDVLTLIDGKEVKSSWDLRSKIRGYDDGQQVPVEVWRNGRAQNLTITLVKRERSELDVAPFFFRGDGDKLMLNLDGEEWAKKFPNLEKWTDESGKAIRWHALASPREAELEKKLKDLEKRIAELEKQLERKR
jgi:membrane-associated protease RseP (regulator of RpoE activity)